MKTDQQLIEWLRQNSSGIYRPSEEGADRIEELLDALSEISKQKLRSEMDDHSSDHADWEEGYESCVLVARKAISQENAGLSGGGYDGATL